MVDPRFFTNAGPFTLGELARRLDGRLEDRAPADFAVSDVATLEDAGRSELVMFSDRQYRGAFDRTLAGVVVTSADLVRERPAGGAHLIFVAAPKIAYTEAAWLFYPAMAEGFGFEDRRAEAIIGEGSLVSASAIIGKGAEIGARTRIGAHAVIGQGVILGEDCLIGPNTMISHAIIGDRVQIYPGCAIGIQGFGFVPGPRGIRRVPQLGRVIIGNDVELGANCTVDRGAIGDTIIGQGTVIDNLFHIAHNVRIGRFCILAAQGGIAGSTELGDGVVIGGRAGVRDHVTIGAGAQIAGASAVINDIEPGAKFGGYPAQPVRDWHRQTIGVRRMFSKSRPDR